MDERYWNIKLAAHLLPDTKLSCGQYRAIEVKLFKIQVALLNQSIPDEQLDFDLGSYNELVILLKRLATIKDKRLMYDQASQRLDEILGSLQHSRATYKSNIVDN